MKKIALSIFALFVAFIAWDSHAKVGTKRFTPTVQIANAIALNSIFNNYYTGTGQWGTFDDLWRDPADAPHPALDYGDFLFHTGTKWGRFSSSGTAGHVLQIGDDPAILGVGTDNIFWGVPQVAKSGTPANNQLAVWTGASAIEGDAALTFDTDTDTLTTVNIETETINGTTITGDTFVIVGGGEITSGSYAPTFTPLLNITTGDAEVDAMWIRVGKIVTVTGKIHSFAAAASGVAQFNLTLPVAAELGFEFQVAGSWHGEATGAAGARVDASGHVQADTSADEARFEIYAVPASDPEEYRYSYTYRIP